MSRLPATLCSLEGVSERDDRHPLDDCPDCGAPMALVLAVLGGPEAHGGGAFRSCAGCGELYARAGEDRRWLDRRGYRMLAREILRLRALVPPEQRDQRVRPPRLGRGRRPVAAPDHRARPPSGTGGSGLPRRLPARTRRRADAARRGLAAAAGHRGLGRKNAEVPGALVWVAKKGGAPGTGLGGEERARALR